MRGTRCPICAEWPTVRHEGYQPPEAEPDECPAVCPECGFRPVTIAYVHDWRGAFGRGAD